MTIVPATRQFLGPKLRLGPHIREALLRMTRQEVTLSVTPPKQIGERRVSIQSLTILIRYGHLLEQKLAISSVVQEPSFVRRHQTKVNRNRDLLYMGTRRRRNLPRIIGIVGLWGASRG